jgi:hypothetical protein
MRYAKLSAALLVSLLPWGALAQTTTPPPPVAAPSASPAPKARSPAMKQARAKRRAACAADLQKFCGDIEPGKGGRQKCLRSHRAEISPECKAARQELRATRAKEKS